MTLLGEIEAAALDSNVPLPDLLRKCKVLAARLKHAEFAAWVSNELNGYPDRASIPSYRILNIPGSRGFFVGSFGRQASNFPVPIFGLPVELQKAITEYVSNEPVGRLAVMAQNEDQGMSWHWPSELVALMTQHPPMYEDMTLVSAYRPISPGVFGGILDTIRTRILDFVLAIQAENPNAGDNAPNKPASIDGATVTQVFYTTIAGGQANIGTSGNASIGSGNVATGKMAGGDITEPGHLLPLLEKLHREAAVATVSEDSRSEAIEVVDRMKKTAAGPKEKFNADKMLKYLSVYTTLVTAASETVPQLEHALKFLSHLVAG